MIRALKAEWVKLTTTKLWWIMGLGVVLLMAGFAALFGLIYHFAPDSQRVFGTGPGTLIMYTVGQQTARILGLVVGVMAMGNEYRHKTLATTYLATPNRYVVLAAKALTMLGVGMLYGIAGMAAGVVGVAPFVALNGGSLYLDSADTWQVLAMGVVVFALWTLMGMGFGILIRNLIAAVVIAIAFAYMIEPLTNLAFLVLTQLYPGVGIYSTIQNLMPSAASTIALGVNNPLMGGPEHPFPQWGSVLVLLGWAVVPALIGSLITIRRDVD